MHRRIDAGSPLSLLYNSGGGSGSGSGLSGGLAIRSDILDGLTGVVMQVRARSVPNPTQLIMKDDRS